MKMMLAVAVMMLGACSCSAADCLDGKCNLSGRARSVVVAPVKIVQATRERVRQRFAPLRGLRVIWMAMHPGWFVR